MPEEAFCYYHIWEPSWDEAVFPLPYFIPTRTLNHPPPPKRVDSEGGRFTACSMLCYLDKHKLSWEPLWAVPFSMCVLMDGSYPSVLHTGSLLVVDPYLALNWETEAASKCWIHMPWTKGSFEIFLKTSILWLSSKKVFWKVCLKLPKKFVHLWYPLGTAEQKQWVHSSIPFWLKSSTSDRKIAQMCQGPVTFTIIYFRGYILVSGPYASL